MKNWFDEHYLKICIALVTLPVLMCVPGFPTRAFDALDALDSSAMLALLGLNAVLLIGIGMYMLYGLVKSRKYKAGLLTLVVTLFAAPAANILYTQYQESSVFSSSLEAAQKGNADALLRLADARSTGVIFPSILINYYEGEPVFRHMEGRPLQAEEVSQISALIDTITLRSGKNSSIDNCLIANLYMHGLSSAESKLDDHQNFDKDRIILIKEASDLLLASQANSEHTSHEKQCDTQATAKHLAITIKSLQKYRDFEQLLGGEAAIESLRNKLLLGK
jgi:hypothetical protein